MVNKLRLVEVQLQYVAVYDDGETLEKIVSQPMVVSAKNWIKVVDSLEEELVYIGDQIDDAGGYSAFAEKIAAQQK